MNLRHHRVVQAFCFVTQFRTLLALVCLIGFGELNKAFSQTGRVRVGSAAVNLECNEKMEIAGGIESRFTNEQEGELRSVAIVIESPGQGKIAIVSLDILFIPRDLVDTALAEVEKTTGILPTHVMVHATHTHHAPSVTNVHGSKASEEFRQIVVKAIIKSVQDANRNLGEDNCRFFFRLSEENTIGGNSRFLLEDGLISWLSPMKESAGKGVPTGPFDPDLPVLDFRDPNGKTRALIFNHSTHTIGTRKGGNVRSPSFYGLAAQELEQELGGNVSFLEGASGSTHNITGVPVGEAINRLKKVVKEAREQAEERPVKRLAAIRRPFKFKVRQFNDEEEDQKILKYTGVYAKEGSDRIRKVFAESRDTMRPHQGEERETYIQVLLIGDVALVAVPAEYFTVFGVDIKRRSPFKNTYVAELANDWVGYLPDRLGHRLGGYQTWLGLHSYAEIGTGERVADEAVKILNELANPVAAVDKDQSKVATNTQKAADDKVPSPKSPAEEKLSFQLSDPNLQVELVAAEPDVVSPVAIAWDANGRMFVAEMIGYPQTEGVCRIALLEDRDGDGKYTRTSTFADQLNFVNSVMPFRKGILATAAPDILYLEDTDGDGKADIKRVEWTGFATGSQQLRANALHWGLDNFVYGANGRVGGQIRRPNASDDTVVSLGTRDFRFDPINGRFEAIVGQSQFGQAHDDWGNRFLSWNTIPIRHVVLDDWEMRSYLPASAAAIVNMAEPNDTGRIYPISPPPKQFNSEQSIYYNAMCGLSIYQGDILDVQYFGNAFICESLSNLITRRILVQNGPTFISERDENEGASEFLASSDSWFHPVFTTTGPDGALYVADFYREFVEHPIYVADVKARAETNWRNGSERGRLWRVTPKDRPIESRESKPASWRTRIPRLQDASAEDLITHFYSYVGWWRLTAQRLLIERQDKSVAPLLRKQMKEATAPIARFHCLWTLHGLNALTDEDLRLAIDDTSPHVRRQAVRAAAGRIVDSLALQKQLVRMIDDPDILVRFQVILALSEVGKNLSTAAYANVLQQDQDPWLRLAVLCSVSQEPWPLLDYLLAQQDWLNSTSDTRITLIQDLAEQLTSAEKLDEDSLSWLVAHVASIKSPGGMALISGLARGVEARGLTLQRAANQANSPWAQLQPILKIMGVTAATQAVDEQRSNEVRRIATELVGHLPVSTSPESLLTLLGPTQPQAVQTAAAKAAASLDDPALYAQIFDNWQALTTVTRRDLLNDLLRTKASVSTLLDAVADDRVPKAEVPSHVRDALWQNRDPAINERAKKVLVVESASDRQEVVTRYLASVPATGDASRGVALFRQHCAVCHAVKGIGQKVGPDLAAVGSRRRDFLVVDVLDPSRHVTPDFRAFIAMTRQGRVVVGVMAAETPTSITLRRERGEQETVLRSELEELRPTSKSIMPDGFEKVLSPEQLADVLEYLRKPDGF